MKAVACENNRKMFNYDLSINVHCIQYVMYVMKYITYPSYNCI